MLNKSQTVQLARVLNLFAQAVIKSKVKVADLEKAADSDRPLPVKEYKQVKRCLEDIIGQYMASRDAGKMLAVVYESTNPRVPDTAFGPFASSYEATSFRQIYEVLASTYRGVTPGVVDFIPLRDPAWPLKAIDEAMEEREEELAARAATERRASTSETWCKQCNPFWEPPATSADVPAKLQKQVNAFLEDAAQVGERIQGKEITQKEAQVIMKTCGEKVAKTGGGWGALSYAFWRLRNDGASVETIHASVQARHNPAAWTDELRSTIWTERLFIKELDSVVVAALYGWAGVAGWAP